MRHTANHQSGFTLIELAIVLTILGLLTAGVMAGRTMVRQAQVRSVISETERYKNATLTFLNQFNAVPGDMHNAYTYWGTECENTGNAVTDAENCNGNSDRRFDPDSTGVPLGINSENFRYWQHLVLAELIPGPFTGRGAGTSGLQANSAINVPPASLGNGSVVYSVETFNYAVTPNNRDPHIVLGAVAIDASPRIGAIAPRELSALDEKVDDGVPNTGTLGGENASDASPINPCFNTPGAYLLSTTIQACTAWFRMLP